MGECRFDKDGYCVTPDHATSGMAGPALCGIGKADLKRRVEAFEQLQQAVSVLSANVARLEKEKAQVEREAKEWAEKCVEARLAGHELPLVRKRLEQSEAREAAREELMLTVYGALVECAAILVPGRSTALSMEEVKTMAVEAIERWSSFNAPDAGRALAESHKTAKDLIRKIARQVLGREDAYGLDILDSIRALAAELKKLREVAKADCPKDWYRAQEIHEWLKREGWPTFEDLPVFLATHLQKALEKGWQLRDTLAAVREVK